MKKAIESLLVLACLCLPASAQTTEACRAELKHMNVSAHAEANAPLRFLFAEHGSDFYSATDFTEPNFWQWIFSDGFRVIMVYQDEEARQRVINGLRQTQQRPITVTISHKIPLDNLKFSVLNFKIDEPDLGPELIGKIPTKDVIRGLLLHHLMNGEWYIMDVLYYEPQACETPQQRDLDREESHQMMQLVLPHLDMRDTALNWVATLTWGKIGANPYNDPELVKIIQAVQVKLREVADRN
jgi:hypothetical protein